MGTLRFSNEHSNENQPNLRFSFNIHLLSFFTILKYFTLWVYSKSPSFTKLVLIRDIFLEGKDYY